MRTRANVVRSDGTLIIGDINSVGSKLTLKFCKALDIPSFHIPFPLSQSEFKHAVVDILQWIKEEGIEILNVAGNRESKNKGIGDFTKRLLIDVLREGD